MKKIIYISVIFLLYTSIYSQTNLVPNPSFEQYVSCPNSPGQFDLVDNWIKWGSVDYYNVCSVASNVSVPNNWGGFQVPSTGNAYAGFITYVSRFYSINGREFLSADLSSPLIVGTKYYVSYKISLSLNVALQSNCASNNVGMLFTEVPPLSIFPRTPQINTTNLVTDTSGWTTLFSSLTADSAYSTIYLGNFFDDLDTDTSIINGSNLCETAYYYIDDICISTDSLFALNFRHNTEASVNELNVFPNPFSNYLNIKIPKNAERIIIYDCLGKIVYSSDCLEAKYNIHVDLTFLNNEVYNLSILTADKIINRVITKL